MPSFNAIKLDINLGLAAAVDDATFPLSNKFELLFNTFVNPLL